jgi:signal transduction histidine kinase
MHFTHGTDIELGPGPAVITFKYAGLSFTNEASVRYKYMLEGFDRDWSPPVQMREVRYTHLPSGTYTFRVIARSADGVWSREAATISFQILPPLWARWWFILLCVLLVGGSIYGFYAYRLNKLLELERTRSRIAMDLHDDIGSSLTRISVLSELAQHQERSNPEATLTTLSKIGTTARELIDSLGDIVWSVDPKHDDLQNVIRRIVQFGQETCEGRGIEFETEIAGDFSTARLSLERRRDVFLIFKEAINNAVRHSQARRVRFCIIPDRAAAVLEFIDDGIGFDENTDKSGNGLRSMRERGARVGGCTIASRPGQGTTVSVRVKTG